MPSSAIASTTGLIAGDRKPSMQWPSASMPVPAVNLAGSDIVRSGSQIATFGSNCGPRTPNSRWPGAGWTPAPRETSLPVPAVVGMAMIGATGPVILAGSAYCGKGGGLPVRSAAALHMSMTMPPPNAMMQSQRFAM